MRVVKTVASLLVIMCVLTVPLFLVGCEEDAPPPRTEAERLADQRAAELALSQRRQREAGMWFNKAEEVQILNNANDGVINASSTKPVTFTLENATTISFIQTYHWDSGKPPGQISLKGEDGTVYGPWTAVGTEGQGGMPNAYWEVEPNQSLAPGTYTIIDSDPGSWSTNEQMGMRGQTVVRGYPE